MIWKERFTNLSTKMTLTLSIGSLLVATFSIYMVVKGARISNIYDHQSSSCQFPAIYNFGDSNSDTGAVSAAFGPLVAPHGMTYFHKPSGRYSDGRLIIDFFAEKLGFPYLSAYLDSIGTNFRHGANFAASGCTIQPADALTLNNTFDPLTLDVQLSQFEQFKQRSLDVYNEVTSSEIKDRLPRYEDYSRALYTFDIGQNDLHAGIIYMKEDQAKTYIPTMISEFASVVEKLYQGGARTFWIHNTGPIGCIPFFVKNYPPSPDNKDQIGCVKSYNGLAQEFNKQLKDKVSQLGTQLQEASFVYVDIYSVKYSLISEANKHGFTDPLGQCLGQDGDDNKPCANPSEYISWDGIHYTEAANKWIANNLQNGYASSPKVPLTEACQATSSSLQ
ncbi:SGNH hydrolase-type esterase domain-containing protein [Artemisia annua]|uniref:SGNH hydrolase-type esterase domain-containing protein n=1 Tax=Artemisia annua TaxID=35608 RepID=A0A2U1QJ97_ARTAN|nr:SGNH hydrolase-type esterase domain-containing protein [Artemisia annua]